MTEEEAEITAKAENILVMNSAYSHKVGVLSNVQACLKIPQDKKLIKDLCNFDIRVHVTRGCLNFNKEFLKTMAKFFVKMDTLKVITKRIKKLILKIHYMEQLLKEQDNQAQLLFENFKDIDIPKRLQVFIEEGLSIIVTSHNKK